MFSNWAEDNHILAPYLHIGEVFFVALRVILVTANLVVLLYAEHINLLTTHLGKDILRHKSRCLTSEHRHVIRSYSQSAFRILLRIIKAKLEYRS